MKTYRYISFSNKYPQPNKVNPVRSVISVVIKENFSIITMNRSATTEEMRLFILKETWDNYKFDILTA